MKKLQPQPGIKSFADVQIGELFRGLRAERIKDGQEEVVKGKWVVKWREVPSAGLYIKVGSCIAVDIAHGNKDCVFSLKLPCRVLPKVVDATNLDTYIVYHRNQPHVS